jgi:hypothetical protein
LIALIAYFNLLWIFDKLQTSHGAFDTALHSLGLLTFAELGWNWIIECRNNVAPEISLELENAVRIRV